MRLRVHAAAIVTAVALCGPAVAQSAKPEVAVHRLRCISAADAATALTAFAEKNKLPVAVVTEPALNTVTLAGEAAQVRQVAELLTSLDKAPPMVAAHMLVLEVPAGFAEDTGLGEAAETGWVLTPREARMLTAAVRSGQKRDEVDVLARPMLVVADNTTAVAKVGLAGAAGLTARVTPRVEGDGTVLLRVEAEVVRAAKGKAEVETLHSTVSVADGGTLVMRGARTKAADGSREMLVIVTVNRVREVPDSSK